MMASRRFVQLAVPALLAAGLLGAADPHPTWAALVPAPASVSLSSSSIDWYKSKVSLSVEKRVDVCFSGKASDKAGMDDDGEVTGRVWQPSDDRKVRLQRKVGSEWKTVSARYTGEVRGGKNYTICVVKRKGKYRVHADGNYFPYNFADIRARAANSRVTTIT